MAPALLAALGLALACGSAERAEPGPPADDASDAVGDGSGGPGEVDAGDAAIDPPEDVDTGSGDAADADDRGEDVGAVDTDEPDDGDVDSATDTEPVDVPPDDPGQDAADAADASDEDAGDVSDPDAHPCARIPIAQRCETRAELQCIDEVYRRECFEESDGCLVWLRSACDRGTACFEGSCAADECATRGGCASEAWCDDAIAVTCTPDARGCLVERTRRFCPAGCASGSCLSDPCVEAACNPAMDVDRCDEDRLRVCAYDEDFRCSRWFETDCAGASQNCVRVGRRHECRELFCGDGLVFAPEECDDGNTDPGDGCDGICLVEEGFGCEGEPSVCVLE